MPRKRMGPREARKTAESLAESLKSTARGLELLQQSLERGGFKAAIAPYNQMQHVLLQQRLWAVDNRRSELDPEWREIAARAKAIHAILEPFTAVMAVLKDIDRIHSGEAAFSSSAPPKAKAPEKSPAPPPDPLTGELVNVLLDSLSVSGVRLEREMTCPDDVRARHLKALTRAGAVQRRGWGRGRSFQLSPETRQRIAGQIAAVLDKAAQDASDESRKP